MTWRRSILPLGEIGDDWRLPFRLPRSIQSVRAKMDSTLSGHLLNGPRGLCSTCFVELGTNMASVPERKFEIYPYQVYPYRVPVTNVVVVNTIILPIATHVHIINCLVKESSLVGC